MACRGWRACARPPAQACPSSTSPLTGAPRSSELGRWCQIACPPWKKACPKASRPGWGPSAPSWARSCRSPFPSISQRLHPWRCANMQIGCSGLGLAIPGVAQVIPIGGEVRQFQVQPNTVRMAELDITHDQLEGALRGFSSNSSGGFMELNGREYLIRHLGRTSRLDDLKNLALTARNGQAIRLRQVADVSFAPALKRGDAGFEGKPAVILGIQKQPTADTIGLTRTIEAALGEMKTSLPVGMEAP